MALKKKESKEKAPKEKKESHPLVWNPDDGVTWHDFAGIFIVFLKFIYRILRLVLAPVFWIYGENVQMIRFIRAQGEDRTMSQDEREFVESIPIVFAITGLIGGLILGILIVIQFQDIIQNFLESLSLDFFKAIFDVIAAIIVFIVNVIVWIITGIGNVLQWIWDGFIAAFKLNPFVALIMLVVVGVIIIAVWIVFSETGAYDTISSKIKSFISWLIESPNRLRFNIQNYYRRFNHFIVVKLLGQERLATRTLNYFKKTVFYTVLLAVWSYIAGIFVAVRGPKSNNSTFWNNYPDYAEQIVFASTVLLLAGIVSGMIFFMFWARFLDALNRKRYISPEFVTDAGEFDEEGIADRTKEVGDDKPWLREYVPRVKEETGNDEEKPWKSSKQSKKTKGKPEEKSEET